MFRSNPQWLLIHTRQMFQSYPSKQIYSQSNITSTAKRCGICLKLTIMTTMMMSMTSFQCFLVNFEHTFFYSFYSWLWNVCWNRRKCWFLYEWSNSFKYQIPHLLKKSLTENFNFVQCLWHDREFNVYFS